MIKVFQTLTVGNNNQGNCFNACIASLLELPLRGVAQILPNDKGDWMERWRVWLADRGYRLSFKGPLDHPKGYSIATVYTDRVYPETHYKSGRNIAHACVAFDGIIVHDPYPIPSNFLEIQHFQILKSLNCSEKLLHELRSEGGICMHGYLSTCIECSSKIQ